MLSHHLYGNKELKNNVLQKSFHLESFVVFYLISNLVDINTRLYNFHTTHLCIFWHLCKKDIFKEGLLRFNLQLPGVVSK